MEVSKSIWDVRFTSKIAQDRWITMNGSHVEVGDDGYVIRGAGGKFNGRNAHFMSAIKQRKDLFKKNPPEDMSDSALTRNYKQIYDEAESYRNGVDRAEESDKFYKSDEKSRQEIALYKEAHKAWTKRLNDIETEMDRRGMKKPERIVWGKWKD